MDSALIETFGTLAVASVFLVALLVSTEVLFPNTRQVHDVINFPRILRMDFNQCLRYSLFKTWLLAAWSGIICTIVPMIIFGIMVFISTLYRTNEQIIQSLDNCYLIISLCMGGLMSPRICRIQRI